jgi:hypothetical protein
MARMSRAKSQEPTREKEFSSAEEITQAIEKLRAKIAQVEELKKEGLAYRDALRTTAEFQIRDAIREIFGDRSPEFHEHQHHRVKANSKTEVMATISMLQHLVTGLEHKLSAPKKGTEPSAAATDSPPVQKQPSSKSISETVQPRTASPAPERPQGQPPAPPSPPGTSQAKKPAMSESRHAGASVAPSVTPRSSAPKEPSASREQRDAVQLIRKVCLRFHSVVRQLRQRSDDRAPLEVEDETDVRDLLRALLSMEFEDISTEEWMPAYTNGKPRLVILLKTDGIVVEVKKTRPGLGAKELVEQTTTDFQQFPGRECHTVFCFIYDPEGRIPNPRRLEADLTGNMTGRTTEALVSPK